MPGMLSRFRACWTSQPTEIEGHFQDDDTPALHSCAYGERAAVAQALSVLHHSSEAWASRVHALPATIRSVYGATNVSLYGAYEDSSGRVGFVLLSGKDDGDGPDDKLREVLLHRAVQLQVPISQLLPSDRLQGPTAESSTARSPPADTHNPNSGYPPVEGAANRPASLPFREAAIPLPLPLAPGHPAVPSAPALRPQAPPLILWVAGKPQDGEAESQDVRKRRSTAAHRTGRQPPHNPSAAYGMCLPQPQLCTATSTPPIPAAARNRSLLLSEDSRELHSLAWTLSAWLLGCDQAAIRWLTGAVRQLHEADSMAALTRELCAALSLHVASRFGMEPAVHVALVPQQGARVGLMLAPTETAAALSRESGDAESLETFAMATAGPRARVGVHTLAPPTGAGARRAAEGTGPAAAEPARPNSRLYLAARDTASLLGNSQDDDRLLLYDLVNEPAAVAAASPTTSTAPVRQGSCSAGSSDASSSNGGSTAGGNCADLPLQPPSTTPSLLMFLAAGASGVVPLAPAQLRDLVPSPAAHGSRDTAADATCACGGLPGLRATPFPLGNSVIQLALQEGLPQAADAKVQGPWTGPPGQSRRWQTIPASLPTTVGAAGPKPLPGVRIVEDVLLQMQDAEKPFSDLAALLAAQMAGAHGAGAGLGAGGSREGVRSSGRGRGACGGSGWGCGGAQALALLTLPLDGGAALGVYLCFDRALPVQLLETVRGSCQEVLDKALRAPVLRQTRGPLAAEYDTLRAAVPGSYAVIRADSNGLMAPANGGTRTPHTSASSPDLVNAENRHRTGARRLAATARRAFSTLSPHRHHLNQDPGRSFAAAYPVTLGAVPSTLTHSSTMVLQTRIPAAGAVTLPSSLGRPTSSPGPGPSAAGRMLPAVAAAAITASARGLLTAQGTPGRPAPRRAGLPVDTARASSFAIPAVSAGAASESGAATMTAGGGREVVLRTASRLVDASSICPAAAVSAADAAASVRVSTVAVITVVAPADLQASAPRQLDILVKSIHARLPTFSGSSFPDDLSSLELLKLHDSGGGGVVYRGAWNKIDVAIKLFELPDGTVSASSQEDRQPRHPVPKPATGRRGPPPGAPVTARRARSGNDGSDRGSSGNGGGGGGDGGCADAQDIPALDEEQMRRMRRHMLRVGMESVVLRNLSHPNILQMYFSFSNVKLLRLPPNSFRLVHAGAPESLAPASGDGLDCSPPLVALVFEWADLGSLQSALAAHAFQEAIQIVLQDDPWGAEMPGSVREHTEYDMQAIYMTLLDVALALRHLHSLNLVHRDLKPANLLLKSKPQDYRGFTVKLADFGFVQRLTETAEDGSTYATADVACGTVTHMPPEAFFPGARVGASTDVYAFGILMWEMLAGGVRPYAQLPPERIPRAVCGGARPSFPPGTPAAYRSLAEACWSQDPARRPAAADLVSDVAAELRRRYC